MCYNLVHTCLNQMLSSRSGACCSECAACLAELLCACVQSVLARGLHALLPPIEVVKGSYCNANPENPREWEVRHP